MSPAELNSALEMRCNAKPRRFYQILLLHAELMMIYYNLDTRLCCAPRFFKNEFDGKLFFPLLALRSLKIKFDGKAAKNNDATSRTGRNLKK